MDRSTFDQAKLFIFSDVDREIRLAKVGTRRSSQLALRRLKVPPGGGNFLAALGLLCYTEFAGKLMFKRKAASANFNEFFDFLGPDYATLRKKHNVYDIFRCGLAHEFYVKRTCTIAMLARTKGPGIRVAADGTFKFVVEAYNRDLKRAFERLTRHLFP